MSIQECNKIVSVFSSHNKVVKYLDKKYKIIRAFVAPSEEEMFMAFISEYQNSNHPESISAIRYVECSDFMVLLECIEIPSGKRTFLRHSDVSEQI